MNIGIAANIVIGLGVLGLLLFRQIQTRPIKEQGSPRLLPILGCVGLIETAGALNAAKLHSTSLVIAILWIVSSLVIASLFALVRGITVKIWRDSSGKAYRRGTIATISLWIIAILVHFLLEIGINHAAKVQELGNATLLLYIAVSFGVQRQFVQFRAQKIAA